MCHTRRVSSVFLRHGRHSDVFMIAAFFDEKYASCFTTWHAYDNWPRLNNERKLIYTPTRKRIFPVKEGLRRRASFSFVRVASREKRQFSAMDVRRACEITRYADESMHNYAQTSVCHGRRAVMRDGKSGGERPVGGKRRIFAQRVFPEYFRAAVLPMENRR